MNRKWFCNYSPFSNENNRIHVDQLEQRPPFSQIFYPSFSLNKSCGFVKPPPSCLDHVKNKDVYFKGTLIQPSIEDLNIWYMPRGGKASCDFQFIQTKSLAKIQELVFFSLSLYSECTSSEIYTRPIAHPVFRTFFDSFCHIL